MRDEALILESPKKIKRVEQPSSDMLKIRAQKLGRFLLRIVRGTVIVGICFIILQPLFAKISISFMNEKDLYDSRL